MKFVRHKYQAIRTERDGIKFASRAEANRYDELKLLQEAGDIVVFLVQTPTFRLPGGVRYTADFLVFWADGTTTVEDVKGMRTQSYVAKKKQVEALYAPIVIEEK